MSWEMLCGTCSIRVYVGEARQGQRHADSSTSVLGRINIGISRMVQGKAVMRLQRIMALCSLGLTVLFGCLSPTLQSERIDVVTRLLCFGRW